MDTNKNCLEYRTNHDELIRGALSIDSVGRLKDHESSCDGCHQWVLRTGELTSLSADMPQFDVSEKLTQSILQAVESQRKVSVTGQYGLLIPVAAICVTGLLAVFPMETVEGMISTAIGLAGVLLVKMVISGAKTEDLVA